jgi:hypothetical protein
MGECLQINTHTFSHIHTFTHSHIHMPHVRTCVRTYTHTHTSTQQPLPSCHQNVAIPNPIHTHIHTHTASCRDRVQTVPMGEEKAVANTRTCCRPTLLIPLVKLTPAPQTMGQAFVASGVCVSVRRCVLWCAGVCFSALVCA